MPLRRIMGLHKTYASHDFLVSFSLKISRPIPIFLKFEINWFEHQFQSVIWCFLYFSCNIFIEKIQKISISKFIMILNIRTGCQDWFKFIWEIFRYDVDPGTTSNSFQLPKGELFAYSRYVCYAKGVNYKKSLIFF